MPGSGRPDWEALPLFPLGTVLFPGVALPLHIFEERYKLLVNRCLEASQPFGVLLIREGKEVGEPAVPHEVGTTAAIASVTRLEGGRLRIIALGAQRFRLRAIHRDLPYLTGDAEPSPLEAGDRERAQAMVEPVRALLRQYLERLDQAQGQSIEIDDVPSEPRALAVLTATCLSLPALQKQRLLEQPTVAQMLRQERTILDRERLLLEYVIRTQENQWEGGFSGYLARN
jgi:Lon protease-like protein